MNEFTNRAFSKISYYYYLTYDGFLHVVNKVLASIKGIKIGSGFKTFGKMYFFRFPGSKITIGNNCQFRSRETSNMIGVDKQCMITTHNAKAEIIIGNNCGFSGVVIGCQEKIIIGNDCMIGGNVIITDTDWHSMVPGERSTGVAKSRPTILHNDVFIGAGSIILKGTTIGENSVIGAGSVVSGNIPANVIAAGNPCKVLKQL